MCDLDRENDYYATLPRCCWCRDTVEESESWTCEKCGDIACVDHTGVLLNGDVGCFHCKADQLAILRMADEIFGVAV